MKKYNLKEDFMLEPVDLVNTDSQFDERSASIYCNCILLRQIKRVCKNRTVMYKVYNLSKESIRVIETDSGEFICNIYHAIKKAVGIISTHRRTGFLTKE